MPANASAVTVLYAVRAEFDPSGQAQLLPIRRLQVLGPILTEAVLCYLQGWPARNRTNETALPEPTGTRIKSTSWRARQLPHRDRFQQIVAGLSQHFPLRLAPHELVLLKNSSSRPAEQAWYERILWPLINELREQYTATPSKTWMPEIALRQANAEEEAVMKDRRLYVAQINSL